MPVSTKHEMTELDKIDLTGVVFEMLTKYDNVDEVKKELLLLKPTNIANFNDKFNYAVGILNDLRLLKNKTTVSKVCRDNVMVYGNCGDARFNAVLYESYVNGCFENMAAVVAFAMMGTNLLDTIIKETPPSKRAVSGDIETVGKFVLEAAEAIDVRNISHKDIMQ
jgi:hypothetical protein